MVFLFLPPLFFFLRLFLIIYTLVVFELVTGFTTGQTLFHAGNGTGSKKISVNQRFAKMQ